jgi:hypothetical protein
MKHKKYLRKHNDGEEDQEAKEEETGKVDQQ